MRRLGLVLLVVGIASAAAAAAAAAEAGPRANWDFAFRDFVIGAWWGPDCNDVELAMYRDCGFNTVMTGRYMNLYGTSEDGEIRRQLDLCGKHGLKVFMDTYAKNERPWGGQKLPPSEHPTHHPASVEELTWLLDKVGDHPALIGFMIGDDQGSVSARAKACTDLLAARGRRLMPWLCGWIAPNNLAANNNPICDPQIYPTLYQPGQSAEAHARAYAQTYWDYSRACAANGVMFWPMFNAAPPSPSQPVSDSLLRYPAYLALAYGAEGFWYFCYNADSLQKLGPHATPAAAVAARTANWPVAHEINQRALPWGRRVLGRQSAGLFGTAFGGASAWPMASGAAKLPAGLSAPVPGKLLRTASDDLIVGILTQSGQRPLAMVVNAKVSKVAGELPNRSVTLEFDPAVRGIRVLGPPDKVQSGSRVTVTLQPGGGQMLELEGDLARLAALCQPAAIAATAPAAAQQQRAVTAADLHGLSAARLRLDVFGSDGGQYAAKWLELNGHRLGQVPTNGADTWSTAVVELTAEQLAWVQPRNELRIVREAADAFKLRGAALAVRLADGDWVATPADATVWSTPDWAFSEGRPFTGEAGPLVMAFGERCDWRPAPVPSAPTRQGLRRAWSLW